MTPTTLEVGDIVQLGPNTPNPMFAYCLMTVTEPKSWGAQGYVQMTGENGQRGGQAYYRSTWEHMAPTGGKAAWMVA